MSAPTPTCPGDSQYDPTFMQCTRKGAFGFPVVAGIPTCPSGYFYMFPNKCMAIPVAPAAPAAPVTPAPAVDPAIAAAQQQAAAEAAATSAQTAVDKYTTSFQGIQTQKNQLQQTLDLMASAKGLYSGVSNDLHYSVKQFDSHLMELQNQINITNKKQAQPTWWPWVDIFLNVMIVFALCYAIYALIHRTGYVQPGTPQILMMSNGNRRPT